MLLTYPNCPPNKLAGMYKSPMVITSIDRPDLIKVRDLITNKEFMVHANRNRPFKHPKSTLAATDLDRVYLPTSTVCSLKVLGEKEPQFYVEKNIQARGRNENFECVGLDTSLKTILCWIGRSRTS